jgi:hypothetical protein
MNSSAMVVYYQPKAYLHMATVVATVISWYAVLGVYLAQAFPQSVYPAATWNFPPSAVTVPHRNAGNPPCLPSSVTALGTFSLDQGGQMVLYKLGLIIRFPPGSFI